MSCSMNTSSSTASTYIGTYSDVHTERISIKEAKPTAFKSKAMEQLAKANVISGRIALFGSRSSPAFADYDQLRRNNINTFYADPVVSGYDSPPELFQYDYAVIIDAFEYIPELMGKANLIKEALSTLQRKDTHIIMMARTIEMVNRLAKDRNYKAVDGGFLISNHSALNGFIMKGVEAEELIMIAHFAGSQAAEIDERVKTDMTCVRARPIQQYK